MAGDGRQCLDAVQRRVPDLVLLDVMMPVMGGVDTLLALRSEPRSSHLPVIMLTDAAERELIIKAGKLGISGYVLKSSFSLETLLGRIEDALDGREMDAELDELGVIEAPRRLRRSGGAPRSQARGGQWKSRDRTANIIRAPDAGTPGRRAGG